ncbi:MAG TPA: S28 family serine protease, partial [Kofleriaceae bacterium]|nr:S28 family serine protease [Kofleriaceae bacterium]
MGGNAYPSDPLHGKLGLMRFWMVVLLALAACSDDTPKTPDEILFALRQLPGVHDATEMPTQSAGYHYYVIHFEQKVDHNDPNSATFLQEVSLLHHDELHYPMVVHTSGYWDYYLDRVVELTALLGANQISIEHRYFGESRPTPTDWTKLTIDQMAADQHEIVTALKKIYEGKFLTTGGSKGGMTATYHRRFYPDDVDGTVPYVAPISFAAPDARYAGFL